MKPIITFLVDWIWEWVKGMVDGVITFFQGIVEFFTGVFTGDWEMAWEGLKKMVFGAISGGKRTFSTYLFSAELKKVY